MNMVKVNFSVNNKYVTEERRKDIKKILLVQPNMKWIPGDFKTLWEIHPMNLCLIAAMIEDQYEVVILDANIENLTQKEFIERLGSHSPDLVGVTMLTNEYADTAHITMELIKKFDKNLITVLGGIYATQAPEQAGQDHNIDYLVVGEGEYTFPKLLNYIQGKKPMPSSGIAYWENEKRVIQDKPPYIEDLDALPVPAYHLVDYQRYTNSLQRISVDSPRSLPYARIVTSRGCGIGCTFCEIEALAGKAFRARSVPHIIKELRYLKDKYHITSVIFDDDNLYINRGRTKELCRAMINEKLHLQWNAIAVPVFYLNEEILELMRESGCEYIDMAIESGVERVLEEIINKPVKLSYAKKMVEKAKSLGIDVNAHFIIGFPGETWDEIRTTIKFAEDLDADYTKFFIYQPLPHTPLYEKVVKEGLLEQGVDMVTDLNWSECRIISNEFSAQDLRVLRAYEWDRINFSDPAKRKKIANMMSISEEELTKLRKDTLKSVAIVTYPAHEKNVNSEALATAAL